MWSILLRALAIGGPAAIGYVSNDLITWLQSLPYVGGFFSKKDAQGQPAPVVQIVTIIGATALLLFILKKFFNYKK